MRSRQLASAFDRWMVAMGQSKESATAAQMEQIAADLARQLEARSNELRHAHMAGASSEHHRQEHVVAIFAARLRSNAQTRVFYAWFACFDRSRRLINLEQKFTRRWGVTVLKWSFAHWYESSGAIIAEREHAEEEEMMALKAAARSQATSRKAARRMKHLRAGAAFGSWWQRCAVRRHRVVMLRTAARRMRGRQLGSAFGGWASAAAHQQARRGVMR